MHRCYIQMNYLLLYKDCLSVALMESGFITYETFDALLTTSWNLGVQHRYIVCVAILNVSNTMELVNHCNTKFKWYYIHVLRGKFIVNHIFSKHLVSKHDHREPVLLFHRQQMMIRPWYIILQVTFFFTLYCYYLLKFCNSQTCPVLVEHSVRFIVVLLEHISSMTSDSQVWPVFTYAELYRTANNGSGKYCLILVLETLSTMIQTCHYDWECHICIKTMRYFIEIMRYIGFL